MTEPNEGLRRHKLLPKPILDALPALYTLDGQGDAAVAQVKFFCPYNGWEWYATEYDPDDGTFFGLVKGDFTELGYFSFAEIANTVLGTGTPAIERDCHWAPRPLADCR